MELTSDQTKALTEFNLFMLDPTEKIMVLRGYSGTGKTALISFILKNIDEQLNAYSSMLGLKHTKANVLLTATTNKAAKVLGEFTQQMPKTIHSLIGLRVVNDYNTGKQSLKKTRDYQVHRDSILIVDEASFVDEGLLEYIEKATLNCKVLFVGDPCQLTPTKASTCPVFNLPVRNAELRETVRTKDKNSDITSTAFLYRDTVLSKAFPVADFNGTQIIHADRTVMRQCIKDEFVNKSNADVKILAWTNGQVHKYNDYIRKLQGLSSQFSVGEKVVTNKPMLGSISRVVTDSILTITGIDPEEDRSGVLGKPVTLNDSFRTFLPNDQLKVNQLLKHLAKHKNWKDYFHIKDTWADLRSLHACTVHKSQGSTYETVFIDLDDISRCNIWSDVARMLYVGISRASEKVIVYGSLPAKYDNTRF